eukprot:GILK01003091.1.p1 GENE.GILK01003091.1~~GILK01003091.1.p1  ORF type:complete len:339 (-),score=50.74 GILK01003091.1:232-1173(-)
MANDPVKSSSISDTDASKKKRKVQKINLEQAARGIALIAYLAVSIPICLILCITRVLNPYLRSKGYKVVPIDIVQRLWTTGICTVMGVTTRTEGTENLEPGEPMICAFAHGSNLDAFLLDSTCPFPCKFIGKKILFKVPFLGWLGHGLGHIPIDRSNLEKAKRSLADAAVKIQGGKSVAISPEGTRRRDPSIGPDQLLPFKKGPFHLAKSAGVAIVPVVLFGANELWPPGQLFPTPGTVTVRYLPKIDASVTKLDIDDMTSTVREAMLKGLQNPPPREIIKQRSWLNTMVFLSAWGFVIIKLWTYFSTKTISK